MNKPNPKNVALLVRTLVGLVLLIGAGSLMAYLIATKPQVSKSDLDELSVAVQVMRIEPVEVARQWRGYGTTQAKDKADVPARVSATVIALPEDIEVGRVVNKGQIIAELDPTDFQNALNAAEKRIAEAEAGIAQLAAEKQSLEERLTLEKQVIRLAKDDYERQLARFETGSASPTDVDRAKRAVIIAELAGKLIQQQLDALPPRLTGIEAQQAAAQADRDTAKANLARTIITSPIDGMIESLDIEVGENLAPGQRVARIIDPRVIELPLQLPASARSFVGTGNTATLTTRSHPDDCPPWKATIKRLGVADSPTRTFTAFAEVDQSHIPLRNFAEGTGPYKLAAGAFTLARLDTAEPKTQTILPARSIQEGRVRTVVDGKIVGQAVDVAFDLEGRFPQFGVEDTQWVVLKDPLEPGTLIILSASMTILDGQKVDPKVASETTAISPEVAP
jgi:multidrug efflux pump subunit AcrA (membrane-fusion protein)